MSWNPVSSRLHDTPDFIHFPALPGSARCSCSAQTPPPPALPGLTEAAWLTAPLQHRPGGVENS